MLSPHTDREEIYIYNKIQDDVKVVFDIGIDDSSHICELTWKVIEIHLFEPNLYSVHYADKIYKSPNIHIHHIGLSNKEESTVLHCHSKSVFRRKECFDNHYWPNIQLTTLDSFVKANNINQPDFIKIDTEGYDGRILIGSKETIKNCKYIQIENFSLIETDPSIIQEVSNLLCESFFIYHMIGGIREVNYDFFRKNREHCNYFLSREKLNYI